MAGQSLVAIEVARGVARIALHGSRAGSHANLRLAEQLRATLEEISVLDTARVVLLSSDGPDFWRGGAGRAATTTDVNRYRIASHLAAVPQPVVVAIQGRAFDQGLEFALAGDIRIAADDARFALRQLTRGQLPFDGGTQRLSRVVRRGVATDMLLTGRELTAAEALACGLVSEVVVPGRLLARAIDIAEGIAMRGAAATRFAREAIRRGSDLRLDDGMRLEADLNFLLFPDEDRRAGLDAFRKRRKRT